MVTSVKVKSPTTTTGTTDGGISPAAEANLAWSYYAAIPICEPDGTTQTGSAPVASHTALGNGGGELQGSLEADVVDKVATSLVADAAALVLVATSAVDNATALCR
jgi:hypothetical protein